MNREPPLIYPGKNYIKGSNFFIQIGMMNAHIPTLFVSSVEMLKTVQISDVFSTINEGDSDKE